MSTISASTTSTTGFKVTSDTTGTLVFQTGASPTTAMTLGSDQSVTFAGAQTYTGAATFTTGISVQGLTVGKGAGAVSTNTAVGASALAANTTGPRNTAVGYTAMYLNQTGQYNSGYGYQALYSTTGSNNTAMGHGVMFSNTSGASNSALGNVALVSNTTGSYNVAIGESALNANTTASYNTAVGYQAGYSGTTAANNTFIGAFSGYSITTGTSNTFVGNGQNAAGYYVTTGSKNTIIGGYSGNQGGLDIRTASNYIVLSDGDGNPRLISNGSGFFGLGCLPAVIGGDLDIIANQNGLGIGYSTSVYRRIVVQSSGNTAFISSGNTASLSSAGAWTNASDARLKKNITGIKYGLSTVLATQPKSYQRNDVEGQYIGFIAQELKEQVPEVVFGSDDEQYTVDYGSLVAVAFKAIQELKAEFDAYKEAHP